MNRIAFAPFLAAILWFPRRRSLPFGKGNPRRERRHPAGRKFGLLFTLVLALTVLRPLQADEKVKIESPADGKKCTSGHVVVLVKVDSSVKRVKAVATVPATKKSSPAKQHEANASSAAAEDAGAKDIRTVFTLGPVDLPRGADRWSPDVELADGENTITISDFDDARASDKVTVWSDNSDRASDTRDPFQGSFYVGASIDSFASNETKQYVGYTAADSGPKTGYVAGLDFQFRVFRRNPESRTPLQLWLFGETVHGQRSAEVDCSQTKGNAAGSSAPAVCAGFNPEAAPDAFLAVLRNASSLEGYAGGRLEFLKLNRSTNYSANLYAKSQSGFMTVQNSGGDLVDNHLKLAFGSIMTNGPFAGSYLDAGWGRTDLFAIHRGRRFKVDGYVQWAGRLRVGVP